MVLKLNVSKQTLALAVYIIISASFMRYVLNGLYDSVGKQCVVAMLWGGGAVAAVIIGYRAIQQKISWLRAGLLLVIATATFVFAAGMDIVEERFHLIMFGLLGWLTTRDCGDNQSSAKAALAAVLFCTVVGTIEEIVQWWLPTRVGEIRDVMFAVLGALIGALLYTVLFNHRQRQ